MIERTADIIGGLLFITGVPAAVLAAVAICGAL
jgi:hypothetical protein